MKRPDSDPQPDGLQTVRSWAARPRNSNWVLHQLSTPTSYCKTHYPGPPANLSADIHMKADDTIGESAVHTGPADCPAATTLFGTPGTPESRAEPSGSTQCCIFDIIMDHFSVPSHPTHAVRHARCGADARRLLIGAYYPVLCPIPRLKATKHCRRHDAIRRRWRWRRRS